MTNGTKTDSLLEKILSTTNTAIFWKDAQRRFVGANKAFLDYYGFSSVNDIIGKTDEEMGWHPDPDPYKNDEIRVLQGEATNRVPGRCMCKGEVRDILASKSPIYENGNIVGLVGTFEDVTEEHSQRAEAERLRLILNNVPAGIAVYRKDENDFQCIAVNKYLVSMLSVDEKKMTGRSFLDWDDVIHSDDSEQLYTKRKKFLSDHGTLDETYRLLVHNPDRYSWCHIISYYVRQNDGREYIYMNITNVDEVKNAEKRADIERQIYENTTNAAGIIVWRYEVKEHRVVMMKNKASIDSNTHHHLSQIIDGVPNSLLCHLSDKSKNDFLELYDHAQRGIKDSKKICFIDAAGIPTYEQISFTTFDYADDGSVSISYGMSQNVSKAEKQNELYQHEREQLYEISRPDVIAKGHHDLTENKVLTYFANTEKALIIPKSFTYDDAYKKMIAMPVSEDDRQKLAAMLDRRHLITLFRTGDENCSFEYRRMNEDKSYSLVETEVNMFSVNDHVECFIFTYDLTKKEIDRGIINRLSELGYEYLALINIQTKRLAYYTAKNGLVESPSDKPLYYHDACVNLIKTEGDVNRLDELQSQLGLDHVIDELQTKSVYEYLYDFRGKDGAYRRKRLQFCYLNDDRKVVFLAQSDLSAQYQHDVEQMHELQNAALTTEKANESKSMFLSNISHDMRTPLNGIIGFTDFALKTEDLEKKQDYLNKIKLSSSLLLSLINETLELSRIESGKVVLSPEVVNSSELLESIVVGIRVNAEKQGIDFSSAFGSDFPENILIDKLRTQEICLNLLSNAVKFTPRGGSVRFIVSQLEKPVDGCNVRIIVEDTGIGISADFLPKIFEPFTQENAPEVKNVLGTGLGLSIVKKYVQMMHGTVEVESKKGKGTKFTVMLPVESASEAVVAAPSAVVSDETLKGKKVLLVEDNYLNREIAVTILSEKGISVTEAEDGQKGFDAFSTSSPGTFDVILMDLRMPVMNGYESTAAIRSLNRKDAKKIPIIAMTADAYDEDVQHCKDAGMNGHITKPINAQQLFAELEKLCGEKNEAEKA